MNARDNAVNHGPAALPGLFAWQVLFLAFACGLFAAAQPEALCGIALLWLLCRSLRARPVPLAILALCGALGLGWAVLRAPASVPGPPAWLEEGRMEEVHGTVAEVQSRPNRRIVVLLERVVSPAAGEDRPVPGLLVWTWDGPTARPLPGQEAALRAPLRSMQGLDNPGTWDGADYWERQGVAFRTYTRGADPGVVLGPEPEPGPAGLRQILRRAVERLVPHSQGGAVVLAVLTGDRFLLSPATLDLMRDAGLSHSLALSGLHLGFVAAVGAGLAYGLSLLWPGICLLLPRPKLAVLVAAPLVLAYAWLGQPAPSLVRAACMFASWGLLLLWDRQRVLLDGLFLALACILVLAPGEIHELSLQLSVAAVAGIAVFWEPLWRLAPRPGGPLRRILRWAYGMFLVSSCANLAVLPVQSWHFGVLAPNFLANLFWLPVLGLGVMPLGLAGLALMSVWPGAAALCLAWAAGLAQASLKALIWADGQGWLPLIQTLRPLWPELLGGTLLLACLPLLLRRRTVPAYVLGLGLLLLLAPHGWIMARDALSGPSLTLLDVGQGQAALLTLPGGRRVLVDGGGSRSATFDPGRAVVAPSLTWGRPPRLDAVLLSRNETDHSRGLAAILEGFRVGLFGSAVEPPERLRRILRKTGVKRVRLSAGRDLDLGDGFVLETLAPWEPVPGKRRKGASLVLRLAWNGLGLALLPGDQDAVGLRRLLESGRDLRAALLVLPDHGGGASCAPEFYAAVSPAAALASCPRGRDLPAACVRQALAEQGIPLWTTAECGRLRGFPANGGALVRRSAGRACPALEQDILP